MATGPIHTISSIEHFNAMETDYTWDDADRLTGIAHNGPTNLVAYSFALDANGNRTQETISPGPVMPVTLTSDDTSFAYNLQRNRLNATSKPTYHYDQGQLTGNVNTIANQYTYDDEGQLTGKGTKAYTFDDAHRLIQRGTDTFVYDGVGNRIKATRGSAQAQYIYDAAGNLLAQANATTGAIQRYFIYGAGLAAMQVGSNYYSYHFDGTGHTVALTDKNNLVTHKYAYSPYGKVLGQVEPLSLTQPFKYAGQVGIFAETDNVYYMRARYYDAETGRFISEDPAGFIDGPNLYAYVGGNPINEVDPTGMCPWCVAAGVGAVVGGGLDLGAQLVSNGFDVSEVDWWSVGTSAVAGAAVSTLTPTGLLLGRGGAKAVEHGYSKSAGLLNVGSTRVGWGYRASDNSNVLRSVVNGTKRDVPYSAVSSAARPVTDGVVSGILGGGASRLIGK